MFTTDRSHLPKTVTSYDVWKTLAVVLMIVDHIGFYMFYGDNEWRLVGRLCVPIWFFLVGYASSRDTSPRLWLAALILLMANPVTGQYLLPLNILFSILFVRYCLDPFIAKASQSAGDIFMGGAVLVLLAVPSWYIFEYGTLGLALALLGYIARHRSELNIGREKEIVLFFLVMVFFILLQQVGFEFSLYEFTLMALGCSIISLILFYGFRAEKSAETSWLNLFPIRIFLQVCGRYTLEIYVLHLILLKAIALMNGDNPLDPFEIGLLKGL